MQRPEPRLTNNHQPRHASTFLSAGLTTSRTCARPASMDDGCASIVVERAYTRPPFLGGSATVAPPAPLTTFLWRISHGNGEIHGGRGNTGRQPIVWFGRSTEASIRPARAPADGRAEARIRHPRAPRRPLRPSSPS